MRIVILMSTAKSVILPVLGYHTGCAGCNPSYSSQVYSNRSLGKTSNHTWLAQVGAFDIILLAMGTYDKNLKIGGA